MSRSACRTARRAALKSTALAALMFGLLSATTPIAWAAPGDNGDVKIHASSVPVGDESDDTHVCKFYLDAFNFDTIQQVSWVIDQQPPTGAAQVDSGTLMLMNGTGHTNTISLPAGHYKLVWTFAGEHGDAKHKVFWSTCSGVTGTGPSPSTSPSTHQSSPAPSGGPSVPGGGVNGGGNGPGANLGPNGKPQLAKTGPDVAPLLAIGSGLVLGGSLLLSRRRSSRHG
jgi:LPXTG-motif cell wall-anchored protein